MVENINDHHQEGQDHNKVHSGHRPYWRRAHHDWRFWVGVVLMMVAIVYYIMSDDFAIRPYLQK